MPPLTKDQEIKILREVIQMILKTMTETEFVYETLKMYLAEEDLKLSDEDESDMMHRLLIELKDKLKE